MTDRERRAILAAYATSQFASDKSDNGLAKLTAENIALFLAFWYAFIGKQEDYTKADDSRIPSYDLVRRVNQDAKNNGVESKPVANNDDLLSYAAYVYASMLGAKYVNYITEKLADEVIGAIKIGKKMYPESKDLAKEAGAPAQRTVDSLIKANYDGVQWSDRIWSNQEALRNDLKSIMKNSLLAHHNPVTQVSDIRKKYEVARYQAERILRTESDRVMAERTIDNAKTAGYREVIWTINAGACRICRAHDGEIYTLKEARGLLPAHPNCRCSWSAYVDEDTKAKAPANEPDNKPVESSPTKKKETSNKLSASEKGALMKYIGPDAYVLNDSLRLGAKLTKEQEQWVKSLDNALEKMPKYQSDKPLYRSLTFNSNDEIREFTKNIAVGKEWSSPAYTSVSKAIYDDDDTIRLIIRSSHSGADLKGYNDAEQEVLFGRNTAFKIVDLYKDENGKPTIEMEEA